MSAGGPKSVAVSRQNARYVVALGLVLLSVTVVGAALGGVTAAESQSGPIEVSDWTDLQAINDNQANLSDDYVLVNDLNKSTAGYNAVVLNQTATEFTEGVFFFEGESRVNLTRTPVDKILSNDEGLNLTVVDSANGTIERENTSSFSSVAVSYTTPTERFVGFSEIGPSLFSESFSGSFDGQGNTIRDLIIDRPTDRYTGLFGFSEGTIEQVTLANATITGSDEVGGLVGRNGGTVSTSSASGAVDGSYFVGGLVGDNSGTVSTSSASGAVTGSGSVGGLVGKNDFGGRVSNSAASGAVDGSYDVGGLVGTNRNDGTVSESFATGAVTGSSDVGGLVGQLGSRFLDPGDKAILRDSYYDTQTTGEQTAVGTIEQGDGTAETRGEVTGLTTTQMQGASAVQNMDALDFTNTWRVVTNPPGYPELRGLPDGPDPSLTAVFTITPEDPTVGEQLTFDADPSTPESDIQSYEWTLGDGTTATGEQVTHTYTDSGQYTVELTVQNSTEADTATKTVSVSAPSSPVEISDWTDLDDIRNDLNANYVLVNDLDETTPGYDAVAGPTANGGRGFDPIGEFQSPFTGSFDGQGNTISDLVIDRPSQDGVGLFVESSGTITSISLDQISVTGVDYVGGLVGQNRGTVSNSSVSGAVNGSEVVGGLVGDNEGTVNTSSASGAVDGSDFVGGLAGVNEGTVIISEASGNVDGSNQIGGLVGRNDEGGIVRNSNATGDINGTSFLGGLIGSNDNAIVINSTASGTVTGSDAAGQIDQNSSGNSKPTESGATDDSNLAGGTDATPTVSNSSINPVANQASQQIGGLIGRSDNGSTVRNSIATGSVSGGSFLLAGLVSSNVNSDILNSTSSADVDGTREENAEFNQSIAGLAGFHSGTIANSSATGDVTAPNLNEVAGLVGDNRGTVSNSSAGGTVDGSDEVGGLVGENEGTVSNSSASGTVDGSDEVGGLVGESFGTVSNSSASGAVTGSDDVGGLVGYNFGTVSESFATGAVTGSGDVGGLVGLGGTVTGSYWDIQATGQSQSAGGIGLNTTQMQGASAAQNMDALDFTNTWRVVTNPPGYPELRSLPDGPGPDPPLTAVFNVTPEDPTVGEQLTFDAAPSTPESDIESYNWTLGDGTTATGEQVTHTYTDSGQFTVELTVQDGTETDTATETVSVSAPSGSKTLSVTAKNATGETVSGAELILYTEDSEIVASRQTNQSGVASWSTLTSGEYSVELYGPSGAFWGATAVTVAGDNTSATVQRTAPRLSQVTLVGDENGDGGYYGGRPVTVSPEIQNDGAERPVRVQIKLDTDNDNNLEGSPVLRGGGGTSIPTGEIGYYGYEFDPETNGTKQVRVVTETEINGDWIVTDDSGWIKSFEIEHNIVGFEDGGVGGGVVYSNSTTNSSPNGVQAGAALLPDGTSLSGIELPGTNYETKNTSKINESYPWSAVGRVVSSGTCSGAIIEDNHVLTAAHCVYDTEAGGPDADISFYPGATHTTSGLAAISIEFVQIYKKYVNTGNRTYDIAVLTLSESVSSETGTFGYEAHSKDSPVYGSPWNPFDKEPAHLTGYPNAQNASFVDRSNDQWDMIVQGEGTEVKNTACSGTHLCHNYASRGLISQDTFKGQSGGAVWQLLPSKPTIISIHSAGGGGILGDGIGVRITEKKHNDINEMIAHGYEQTDISGSPPGVETPNSPPDGSSGSATGDPHLTTYDGVAYDFQAVGEFVLTNGSDNTPQVQARLRPIDTGAVSVISAVATQINGTRLTIDARDQQALTINGTSQSIEPGESLSVQNGEIIRTSEKYIVVYPGADGVVDDGDSRLEVTLSGDRLDAAISLNRTAVDSVSGLLGSPDGNASNDLVLANGTVLSSSPSFETLYGQYRDDYRVTAGTSLFDYEDGESTSGFFDPTYPSQRVTVDGLSNTTREQAIDAASAAGLEPGTAQFRDAVIDYALTGNQSYLDSASRAARQTSSSVDATPSETSLTAPGLSVSINSSEILRNNQSLNVSVAASHPDPGNVTIVISNSTEIVYEQNVTGAFSSEQTISWNTTVDGKSSLASAGNYTLSAIATTQAGVENITTSGFIIDSLTVADYADENGIVTTFGLFDAIEDWREDLIEARLLLDVIDAWRSDKPV